MAKTIAQLHTDAQTIENATIVGENTATRVGGMFDDIVDYLEDNPSSFATSENVGDMSIIDDISSIDGKTASEKEDMIPSGQAVATYLDGTINNSPSSAFLNVSFNSAQNGFQATSIRCMYRLPSNVKSVTITSVTSGYRYTFSKFIANDLSLPLINITGTKTYDSNWQTALKTYYCDCANLYIIHVSKSNNGNITPTEALNNVTFTFDTYAFGKQKDFPLNCNDYSPIKVSGTAFDMLGHRLFMRWEIDSATYSLQSLSPQGSAIYDGYLFVYFASDTKLRVFDLLTSLLISEISLSGVSHGNSLQFGSVIGGNGFPLLYISGSTSADNPKNVIYVCEVTTTTASVVRSITLDGNALTYQNCAFDWVSEKIYAATFDNPNSGDVKIIRYDVAGLEASTAATFTPTYEDSATIPYMGVIQGMNFFNNSLIILTSDYAELYGRLYLFSDFTMVEMMEWAMNNDSECQGVTPYYEDGRVIFIIPTWWRYGTGQSYRYRLHYIG